MIKKILLGLFLLFICAIALVWFYGSEKLNDLVKQGIESVGPEVTQSSVTLDSVNLSIFSGNGNLKGLLIGNPKGFETEGIFALGEIDIDIEPKSLFTDTITINRIYIQKPAVTYEQTLSGSNLKELKKNIQAFTGSKTTSTSTEDTSESTQKNIIIRELIIEEGTAAISGMGFTKEVTLPKIELTGIGENGNSQTISQILELVVSEIVKAVGPALTSTGIDGALDEVIKKVGGDSSSESIKKAANKVKELFGK